MERIEIWKPIFIDNEETNYQVSNFGNVKNNKKILKQIQRAYNYKYIQLTQISRTKQFSLHRLVAIAFIPNPENKETVNHKDHNPSNNVVDNLEWATQKEQIKHQRKPKNTELRGARSIWRCDKISGEKIQNYQSIQYAIKWIIENKTLLNTKSKSISPSVYSINLALREKGINGTPKTAFGFQWKYKENNNIQNEIWKKIPIEFSYGKEGYSISSFGRLQNSNGRITSGISNKDGYLTGTINGRHPLLHRLVAQVFIPNPDNKPYVNHIDGNKSNPQIENLEWVTPKENSIHAYNNGLNKSRKEIIQYDLQMNKINIFNSASQAGKILKISNRNIGLCCNNQIRSCGGFIFKFSNDTKNYRPYKRGENNSKKIIQYDLQMNKINEYNSIKEASQQLNINPTTISMVCNNKRKTTGGFIFKFAE